MPASRATAFVAAAIPARATAFVAGSVSRATCFVAGDAVATPTDYAVVFGENCADVTVSVTRNWLAETNISARVLRQDGTTLAAVTLDLTNLAATVRFTPPRDGLYTLLVGSDSGRLYRAPVAVYCRALYCLRELNRPVATGGRLGQAAEPTDAWKQVTARLRCAIAAARTADYATADYLFDSIAPFCTDCACAGCSTD
jgi:hypothetical protein